MLIFKGEGLVNCLRKSLFLFLKEISRPHDIHGLQNEEVVFCIILFSGKAKSPPSVIIRKKILQMMISF